MKYYTKKLRSMAINEALDLMRKIEETSYPRGLKKLTIYYLYDCIMKFEGHIRAIYYVYQAGKIDGIREEQEKKEWNKKAMFHNVIMFSEKSQDHSYEAFIKWYNAIYSPLGIKYEE